MAPRRATATFDLGLPALDAAAAFERLMAGARQGFLIEKTGPGEDAAFLGVAPFETLRVRGGRLLSETASGRRVLPGAPFEALGRRLRAFRAEGARPFTTGAVGSLTYEMVRHLERLPARPDLTEEGFLMLFGEVLVIDRRRGRTELAILLRPGVSRREAARRAEKMRKAIRDASPRPPVGGAGEAVLRGTLGRAGFMRGVRKLKEHIRAGDIFQGVLSESFTRETKASPAAVYAALRRVSPSPYLFQLRDGGDCLLGASPERLVAVVGGVARNCPIAGTRPRSRSAARDKALERAMVRSPKERAEHLMLVDLARNDLGRVCAPGTVRVTELMKVRRFSNVMHLVSEVEGRLERGRLAWDALMASFPAGTVSGAPKVRAMELIAELEPRARGFYAGAVLQHDFSGNLDSCIAIRSLKLSPAGRGRRLARLQAGAGIVADSDPAREYQEVLNKLSGLRRTLAAAEKTPTRPRRGA